MDSTQTTSNEPWHRRLGWAAAFASTDPAEQWAAACSVAGAITAGDSWVDSTAIHEATCGAYDAAAGRSDPDAVPAALGGARRALYWERRARMTLIPAGSLGPRRWQADRDTPSRWLEPMAAARTISADVQGRSRIGSPSSELGWLADLLDGAGWRWSVPAVEALRDAVEAVLSHGRDRARARLLEIDPELPAPAADGLVLLVAGSRPRGRRIWPGAVWLHAHCGPDAAAADPGTRAVLAAAVKGHRTRPVGVAGALVRHRAATNSCEPVTPVERGEAIASWTWTGR